MSRLVNGLMHLLSRWISVRGLDSTPFASDSGHRTFLHVGCGSSRKPSVGKGFLGKEWQEVRVDIDPAVEPDIVSSVLDMAAVPSSAVDAIYCAHNIEHLYPHEIPMALGEFFRVLKPDGFLVLGCPDLQTVCRLVVEDKLTDIIYESAAGAVAPLDVLYGFRPALARGNLFMAHRTGFTLRTLVEALRASGFRAVAGSQRESYFELWVVASKVPLSEEDLQHMAIIHLPS